MLEVGRICMKIAGREAGRYCVVVKKMDESFVMVTGPKELTSVRRRRCNVSHLEPLVDVIKIKSDAPDSDVLRAYQEASITRKLGLEDVRKAGKEKPAAVPKPPSHEKKTEEKAPARRKPESGKPKPKKAAPKKAVAGKAKPPARKAGKAPSKKPAEKKAPARKPAKKPAVKAVKKK